MKRIALLTVVWLLACGGGGEPLASSTSSGSKPSPESAGNTPLAGEPGITTLGTGLVIWESNRGGSWRLWRRDLMAGDLGDSQPLTPEEPGRAHCCAHISPDGSRLAYLSLPANQAGYPADGASGELRVLELPAPGTLSTDLALGSSLIAEARTYFEHRAAVWTSHHELTFIDADGRSALLNTADGTSRLLNNQPRDAHGWLFDPSLRFATTGQPTFSPYNSGQRAIDERANLGGCQPYFSGDGRLGVWVAGAGGPIRAFDLATRRQWSILAKSDSRLPEGRRYLYFPMPSRDGRALAWAASANEHDHTRADYDIFIAETDADTLELIGPPIRISQNSATDRFPDVWLEPLELERHAGEAPLHVRLELPAEGGPWSWQLGDGNTATGPVVDHVYEVAGPYEVTARGADVLHRGRVLVRQAEPPRLLSAKLRDGGQELWLRFDEAIDVTDGKLELGAGSTEENGAIKASRLEENRTAWVITLNKALTRPSEATVCGVRDLAEPPNSLDCAAQAIEPPSWPVAKDALVFLMQSARHQNRVRGPDGQLATTLMTPNGNAFFDRHGAIVLRGGAFESDVPTMERLLHGARKTNELSLEMSFTSDLARTEQPAALFAFAAGSRRNFTVSQEGDRLKLRLRTPSSGNAADRPVVDLGAVTAGIRQHLMITYTPGLVRAYLDGELSASSEDLRSGFFHWQPTHLRLGAEGPMGAAPVHWPWLGRLEGVAAYSLALSSAEVRENFERYRAGIARRETKTVESHVVQAQLLSRSRTPTLEQIAPYQEALAVFEYRILGDAPTGMTPGDKLRVVHRVLINAEVTPIATLSSESTLELLLEPFDSQPQLESLFLSDDLPPAPRTRLWWSERLE